MKKIIQLIDSAGDTIYIAMYNIKNEHFITRILKARERGVNVKMIVDRSNMLDVEAGCAHLRDNMLDIHKRIYKRCV